VVPLPVILCEFMVAFGLALFGANALALIKLRRFTARIVGGIVVGLLVTLWAVATFVSEGYSL